MWLLTNKAGERIYLRIVKPTTIGRKNADIQIKDDTSISRLHATITVQPQEELMADEPTSVCTLTDSGSKYGTYIIKNKQDAGVPKTGYILQDKDTIRFGLQNSIFVVSYIPIITAVSSLLVKDEGITVDAIEKLDGMIADEWSENCTHLTVSSATLTEKAVCAMARGMFIVTAEYWCCVENAVGNGLEIPSPLSYVPKLHETSIDKDAVSLSPNIKRSTLFEGLIFVFFDAKQFSSCGRMITMAGGKVILFAKKPLKPSRMCTSNVIVMRCYEGDESQTSSATQSSQLYPIDMVQYEATSKALQEHKRRTIPDSEIPLAILHCSTEKYCNPTFLFEKMLKSSRRSSGAYSSSKILAIDTQDVMPVVNSSQSRITVPKNLMPKSSTTQAHKRPISEVSTSLKSDNVPETMEFCSSRNTSTDDVLSTTATVSSTKSGMSDVCSEDADPVTLRPLPSNKRAKTTSTVENMTMLSKNPIIDIPIDGNFVTSTPLFNDPDDKNRKTTSTTNGTTAKSSKKVLPQALRSSSSDGDVESAKRLREKAASTIEKDVSPVRFEKETIDDITKSSPVCVQHVSSACPEISRKDSDSARKCELSFVAMAVDSSKTILSDSSEIIELFSTTPTNSTNTSPSTTSENITAYGKIGGIYRSVPGRKRFKKANVLIPATRVTMFHLSDTHYETVKNVK